MEFKCLNCDKDFESHVSFGDDVTCTHCKSILHTEYDLYWDGKEEYQTWFITGSKKEEL